MTSWIEKRLTEKGGAGYWFLLKSQWQQVADQASVLEWWVWAIVLVPFALVAGFVVWLTFFRG